MATISCHPHDLKWVNEQLAQLPAALRYPTAKKYSDLYESATSRRECNTRLREYVDKINANRKEM